jgi:hypothetical protein
VIYKSFAEGIIVQIIKPHFFPVKFLKIQ